ncbi:helix-turn-helix domain-containing protein [Novosphingobium sp. CECT 9465]|uniref:helix-turn-helix domain-containing protein n=1 Tax=Novosphingobium sp. CECT 9465 TaxID=2829794 RepID=UPI001E2C5F4A|nr:helix-turn-helix domain-containing protein [Novosphingobium sp. CECT 9465]CAH0497218.1 hypothetical protein NVSP9465_02270 [Novosphingobium sp. CECT 9465]
MILEMPKSRPRFEQAICPQKGSNDPLLLTVEDTMAKLSLGRTTVFALLAAGDKPNPGQHLKRVRIGRATRVTRASVLALAGLQMRPAAIEPGDM